MPGDSAPLIEEKASARRPITRWLKGQRLSRSFWIFLLASCLFNTGMFIYVLLFNLYLIDIGYKEDFLGLMSSFTTAGNIIGTFGTVMLARRIGLKRSVMLCFAGAATMCVIRALVAYKFTLLTVTFAAGMFFALWAISITVIIAQVTDERTRPVAFSVYLATVIGIGIIIDPIGGRLPIWIEHLTGLANAAHTKQIALLVASTFIFLAILPVSRLKLSEMARGSKLRYPRSQFIYRFMIAVAVLNIATAAFNPFANAYFKQNLGMPVHSIGLVFSGGQLAQVIAILVSPLILNRLGMIWGIMCMELAAGVSLAVLASGPAVTGAVLGFAGYMAFQWMDEPAMESLLMTRVEPEERSGASAMMYMTIFAAGAVSAPIAGEAITRFGYGVVIGTAAFLLLVGGLLFGLLLKKFERPAVNTFIADASAGASSD